MLPLNKVSKLKLMEIVARVDFFKGFTLQQRELLLERAKCYKCVESHLIQSPVDHNSHFYIILSGEAAIFKQGVVDPVGHVKAGEFIGEGSFIKRRAKSTAARATTDSIVLCMDQDTLQGLPADLKNTFKDAIIEGMAKRIMYLSDEIIRLGEIYMER